MSTEAQIRCTHGIARFNESVKAVSDTVSELPDMIFPKAGPNGTSALRIPIPPDIAIA